jgi:hemin uptake protein HemP
MSVIEEAKKIIEELEKLKEPDGSIIIEHNGVRYKILDDGEK